MRLMSLTSRTLTVQLPFPSTYGVTPSVLAPGRTSWPLVQTPLVLLLVEQVT